MSIVTFGSVVSSMNVKPLIFRTSDYNVQLSLTSRPSQSMILDESIYYPALATPPVLIKPAESRSDVDIEVTESLEDKIKAFETQFGMSSEEFMRRWMSFSIPETFETNYWAHLIQLRDEDDR
jgi:hypothetical protein